LTNPATTVPLVDLRAQYSRIREEIDEAMARVVQGGRYVLGPEVEAFEDEFASYCGTRYGIGVSSGSSALLLSLLAAGIGPGDEVITTPLTFAATTEAITHAGATIRFVDVDSRTGNIDPGKLEAAITSKTKAMLPVHLYGQPADMDAICEVARAHQLIVIEDAAQAHGARYSSRPVGSFGVAACFSFFPAKNLGAYGDGGMVVTNDPDVAEHVRLLRVHGQRSKYEHAVEGYGERLDELQAAVLRVKLRHLDEWNAARNRVADFYDASFSSLGMQLPHVHPAATHVYHLYVVLLNRRDEVRRALTAQGIETGLHYPIPLHLQGAYASLGHGPGDFPHAEAFAARGLSLPMYPELTTDQLRLVEAAMHQAVGQILAEGDLPSADA
jgi:dTDP-4-amino-4,6-dideoxygalactose transaminase